LGLPSFLYGVY